MSFTQIYPGLTAWNMLTNDTWRYFNIPDGVYRELWVRFNVNANLAYYGNEYSSIAINGYNKISVSPYNILGIYNMCVVSNNASYNYISVKNSSSDTAYSNKGYFNFSSGTYEILCHLTTTEWEIYINNKLMKNGEWAMGDINISEMVTRVGLCRTDQNYQQISNIIISSEPITPKHKILEVPTTLLSTTMTANGSSYTADAENEQVLLSLNPTIESAHVESLHVCGQPAYYEGDGLTTLVPLKSTDGGTTIVEGAGVAADTLTSAFAQSEVGRNLGDISQLSSLKLGWKVGV